MVAVEACWLPPNQRNTALKASTILELYLSLLFRLKGHTTPEEY